MFDYTRANKLQNTIKSWLSCLVFTATINLVFVAIAVFC